MVQKIPDAEPADPAAYQIELFGEVDMARQGQLGRLLDDFKDSGAHDVVVDLRAVTFMDSTGLGFLATLVRQVKQGDGKVEIVGARGPVRRVIEISGLDRRCALIGEPLT